MGALLGGGGDSAKKAAAAQMEQNRIAQARQQQQLQADKADASKTSVALTRAPRGRRLLTSSDSGGLASTLG